MKKLYLAIIPLVVVGFVIAYCATRLHDNNDASETTDVVEEIVSDDVVGPRNGVEKTYYDDGTLWAISNYKDGMLDGKRTTYSQTGQIIEVKNFKNGTSDGATYGFYDDGTLEVEVNYIDGKKDGVYKNFYPNGNNRLELNYTQDVINGTAHWYNKDGTTHADAIFENGKIVSGHLYDENGNVSDMTDSEMNEYQEKTK